LNILIDDELKDIITEEWIGSVLNVIDPKMLDNLTLKIIEPSKYDNYQDKIDSGKWDDEDVQREISRRRLLGFSPGPKEAELHIRRAAWSFYTVRRDLVKALYHEVYHANDPERNEDWRPGIWEHPVLNHTREVRATAYSEKIFRRLKDKRKIIMTNAQALKKMVEES